MQNIPEPLNSTDRGPQVDERRLGPEGGASQSVRTYEIAVIVDSGLEDEAIAAAVHRVGEHVIAAGGEVAHVERWGRRRLAYEIGHRSDGYYAVVEVKLDPAAVAGVERSIRLADEIVRHKVVQIPEEAVGLNRRPAPSGS
jgi:small subunit ribosomal protein S6